MLIILIQIYEYKKQLISPSINKIDRLRIFIRLWSKSAFNAVLKHFSERTILKDYYIEYLTSKTA
jgi:hypothetical protein